MTNSIDSTNIYTKNRINLNCCSTCQLSCSDCLKTQSGDVPDFFMDMPTFKLIVDKCVDYGFKVFELTPPYGDPLCDSLITERIAYLCNKPEVEEVFFYTNLINLNRGFLDAVSRYRKFNFRVSVYGDTYDIYHSHTGTPYFFTFVDRLEMLSRYVSENFRFRGVSEFSMRFKGFDVRKLNKLSSPMYMYMFSIINQLQIDLPDDSGIDEYSINTNILCKVTEDVHTLPQKMYNRSGICPMAVWDNGIYPDGDVVLCKWCDRNKMTVIGNIFEQSLDEIYSDDGLFMRIMDEQKNGLYRSICKHCNIFDSEHYKKELL